MNNINWIELLQTRATQLANQTAYTYLIDGDEQIEQTTYSQLDKRARQIAAHLQMRYQPGDRAIMVYPTRLAFIEALFGCLYAGIIAIPVPEPVTERHLYRIQNVVMDARTPLLLTTEQLRTLAFARFGDNPMLQALDWTATDSLPETGEDDWVQPDISGEKTAFIQYTSGSTGTPKGVMVSHRNILLNNQMISDCSQVGSNAVFIAWVPHFHDMDLVGNLFQATYSGAHSVNIPPFAFLQKPVRWLRAISKYGGQFTGSPNFGFAITTKRVKPAQCEGLDLSSLQLAFNGGEPVREQTLIEFQEKFAPFGWRPDVISNCLGMAEASLFVTGTPYGQQPKIFRADAGKFERNQIASAENEESAYPIVSCGRFDWGDQQLKIVNPETLQICSSNELGEVWIAGSHVGQGYWQNEKETERTFRAYTADGVGPFLRTGDLGFVRDDELYIAGRIKDLIIIDGENHYPQDIEYSAENAHPAVRKGCCAAFSVEHNQTEKAVVVIEVRTLPDGASEADSAEIVNEIRRAVSAQHGIRLHEVVLIKPRTIYKTSSGKIQRLATKGRYLAGKLHKVMA